ncbi:hypothetical protein [Saccharopolyspora hattusasensis]|uniref:hypothetical protein n=1 Tax=Saccharopolyspora hattusasensis TaxID=1128679 RepID=UPI003D97D52B
MVTALLLMLRRSVAKAEDEVRGELLTDLLTSPDRNRGALLACRGRRRPASPPNCDPSWTRR